MATIQLICTNVDRTIEVEPGLTLVEVVAQIGLESPYGFLGATVNNRYVGLSYRVFKPLYVTFLDIKSIEGERIYTRTLTALLNVAVTKLMPGVNLAVMHTISKGLFCSLYKDNMVVDPTTEQTEALYKEMERLRDAALPIERKEMPTEEAVKLVANREDTKQLLEQHGELYTVVHLIDGVPTIIYGDMAENTSAVKAFGLKEFYSGLLIQLPSLNDPNTLAPMTLQSKMFDKLIEFDKLLHLLRIRHLADLNNGIRHGYGSQIIQATEALHEKNIAKIADEIAQRRDRVKVILVAGPSSSGKTTFSKRLAVQLVLNGLIPVNMSIDNYFVNRVDTPRDENGKYDFDCLEAIDVKLFNEQVLQLLGGMSIDVPKYSFTRGERYYDGEKLKLGQNKVLIIEGNHALTPAMTSMIPDEYKFKIYIAPLVGINFDNLTRIQTSDIRLIRRIVRDYYNRGHNAEATIQQWPSVRKGELKFIYTYQEEANVMFNTCMVYELAVLKKIVEPILLEVKQSSPSYSEAQRLIKFLSYFLPLDSQYVPPTSLIREFLGGSSFVYD